MDKGKILLVLLLLVLFCLGAYFVKHQGVMFSKNTSITNRTSSDSLISFFLHNEKEANTRFTNKAIVVTGKIKEINYLNNRYTIIVYTPYKDHYILCDVDPDQNELLRNLEKGEIISIKGVCKGFLKDIILLHCTLVTNNK